MSSIKTIFNGVEMKEIYHNGSRLDEMYMGGVIVYKRVLEFELDQYSSVFHLRNVIDSKNSLGADVIIVTNNKVQPSMTTGDLSGLNVTFINNGEIRGTNPGNTALRLTTVMKLTNNGWIRGAGGNGGNGGHGGKGATGAKSANKSVTYTSSTVSWPAAPRTSDRKKDGSWHDEQKHGWRMYGVVNSYMKIVGPCGAVINWGGKWGDGNSSACGSTVYIRNDNVSGGSARRVGYGFSAGSATTSSTYTILGHVGGAGGAGGSGGASGRGQSYNYTRTSGSVGSNGAGGSTGGINSATLGGKLYYGNRGGTGYTGGKGGTGGTGGTWGNSGSRGATGGRGYGYGTYGVGGSAGQAAGKSIQGTNHLASGSKIGSISGALLA